MHTGSGPGHRTHTCPRADSTHLSAGQPPSHLTPTFRSITIPATSSKEQLSSVETHTHSHPSKGRARVQTRHTHTHPPVGSLTQTRLHTSWPSAAAPSRGPFPTGSPGAPIPSMTVLGASARAWPWGRSEASPPSSRPAPPTSRALTSRLCARRAAAAPHHRLHAAPQLPAAPGRRGRRSQRSTSWVSAAGPVRCGRASPVTKRNPPPPAPPPRGRGRRQGAPPAGLQCACATAQPLGSQGRASPLSEAPPPVLH